MIEPKHMVRLWSVMADLYGSSWFANFGHPLKKGGGMVLEGTVRTWMDSLNEAAVSPQHIAEALKALKAEARKQPPTLPEFLGLCRQHQGEPLHQRLREADAARAAAPPIEPTPMPPEVSEALRGVGRKHGRRCIFRKGYGWDEYRADLMKAKAEGKSFYEIDMALMAHYGWTEQDEEDYRQAWLTIPGNTLGSLYPKGHEPK